MLRLYAVSLGVVTGTALGHVALDDPNGGEVIDTASVFTIQWHVAIPHDTQDWDLWYSTAGPDGPWTEIAVDLPAGDISGGAVHTFDWTAPDAPDDSVWVRVRQDNSAVDYYDVSEGPCSIVAACPWDLNGDTLVAVADMLTVIGLWGMEGVPADFDGGGVGTSDFLAVIAHWGDCP